MIWPTIGLEIALAGLEGPDGRALNTPYYGD